MLFVEYPKCSTCQKAKRYLEERGAAFEDRVSDVERAFRFDITYV